MMTHNSEWLWNCGSDDHQNMSLSYFTLDINFKQKFEPAP
jgi:hypothetical protein